MNQQMSEAAIQLIQDDPKTPEWVKKFLIGEILPAMAVSVESLIPPNFTLNQCLAAAALHYL